MHQNKFKGIYEGVKVEIKDMNYPKNKKV